MDTEELLEAIKDRGVRARIARRQLPWWRLWRRHQLLSLSRGLASTYGHIQAVIGDIRSADATPAVMEDPRLPEIITDTTGHTWDIRPTEDHYAHLGELTLTESWAQGTHRHSWHFASLEAARRWRNGSIEKARRQSEIDESVDGWR